MGDNWLEEFELYNDFCDSNEFELELIARSMEKAKRVTVLTGAGISVTSGIPDFRSSNGLWKKYDPSIYGTYSNFKQAPEKFWEMIEELHSIEAKPNPVHKTLADLETAGVINTIVTQNVDGLHQEAGSKNVLEMHGTGRTCYCIECNYITESDEGIWRTTDCPSKNIPHCPFCGGLMKLDVVLFGEKLNREIYDKIVDATTNVDFLLVIGTSLQVAPCNVIPFRAKHNGAQVVFINSHKTQMDQFADFCLRGDLNEIVPKLGQKILEIKQRRNTMLRRAVMFSYSLAVYMLSIVVSFCQRIWRREKNILELIDFENKRSETPMVIEEFDHSLRRHSVPLDDEVDL